MKEWIVKGLSQLGFINMFLGSLFLESIAQADDRVFMPPQATDVAVQVDSIYAFLLWASLISFILVVGGMLYFVYKYKRTSSHQKSAYITHNHTLEFLWSSIPFLIFMFVFAWGWYVYDQMRTYPADSLEVHVFAKKWDWKFVYKNGKESVTSMDANNNVKPATLVVPLGKSVKLLMSSTKINPDSKDPSDRAVLHSFFVPAFRVKQDVVPGRYTALTFKADKLGEFYVFCAEFCGGGHSTMRAMVKVVTPEEFEKWLASEGSGALSLADKGRAIYAAKACIGCHSLDGSRVVGPSFKGFWGRIEEMVDGSKVTVNEDYIRESILDPNIKVVKTFPSGVMPVFKGQVTDEDITALIEFIKTVK